MSFFPVLASLFESKASATNTSKYTTNIVNNYDVNQMNEGISTFTTNTIMSHAQKCVTSSINSQNINIGSIIATDHSTIDINKIRQGQIAVVNFDCVSVTNFKDEIANNLLSNYLATLKNSFTANMMAKLAQNAKASASTGFLSQGSSSSTSNNTTYNYNVKSDVDENIQNIIKTAINNNFNTSDVQSCVATVKNSQNLTYNTINASDGSSITIGLITQTQAASVLGQCISNSQTSNNITNSVFNGLGIDTANKAETTGGIDSEQGGGATAKSTGVFQSIGKAIGDIFGGLASGSISSWIVCILCICCLLSLLWYVFFGR